MDLRQRLKLYREQGWSLKPHHVPRSIWRNPIHFFACGFGVGAFPWVPGTIGTLLAVPIAFFLAQLGWWWYLGITLLYTLAAIYACDRTARDWGVADPPATISDEIAGYLFAMIGLPTTWPWLLAAFVLFRFFDIVKPGPIGWSDRHVHGGLGIVLDDVLSGVVVCVLLQLVLKLL